jgi:pilus assembly protein CpaF
VTAGLLASVRRRLARGGGPLTAASVVSAVRQTPQLPLAGGAVLELADRIGNDLLGAGPLQTLVDDPRITDILVNGPGEVWVDTADGLQRRDIRFRDATAVRLLATRLANACGRRLDDAQPCVDARLPDGTRLHAVLPPIAGGGPYLSLRTHHSRTYDVAALRNAGTLTPDSAALISAIVAARLPFLISGGTGSGKTTLLGAMLGEVAAAERIVIVEDAGELTPRHPHVLTLQARHANVEGVGEVDLRQLVRQALRMRPDRVIVGECRGAEVAELLTALNTGHDGGAGTLHANTAADVPSRLAALALPHGLSREGLHALVTAALRIVIHMRRQGSRRVVTEVSLLEPSPPDALRVIPAWRHGVGFGPGRQRLGQLLASRQVSAT